MKRVIGYGLLGWVLFFANASWSFATVVVSKVQAPASVFTAEGGSRVLKAGDTLQPEEHIITLEGGWVELRIADQARLRIDEKSNVRFGGALAVNHSGAYSAIIDIRAGSARLTAAALAKGMPNLAMRAGVLTAKVSRKTDVWMHNGISKDVCSLLSGSVEVVSYDAKPFIMSEAASFYIVPSNQLALPIEKVPPEDIVSWLNTVKIEQSSVKPSTQSKTQTAALAPTKPSASVKKRTGSSEWKVVLASLPTLDAAKKRQQQLLNKGQETFIEAVDVKNEMRYRILAKNFASLSEAKQFAKNAEKLLAIKGAWLTK